MMARYSKSVSFILMLVSCYRDRLPMHCLYLSLYLCISSNNNNDNNRNNNSKTSVYGIVYPVYLMNIEQR